MGLLSVLNPFTYGRKYKAAWNALMASYTFMHLTEAQQYLVLSRVRVILEGQLNQTIEDVLKHHGRIVFLNFMVYGLSEEGIPPALGSMDWIWIKNPFVGCIGVEDILEFQKQHLEREYGVQFDLDL